MGFMALSLQLFFSYCSLFCFRLEKERDSLFIFRRSNLRCHYRVTYHFYQDDSVEFVDLISNFVKEKEKTCDDQTGKKKSPFILGNNGICPLGLHSIPFHRIHLIPSG